MTGTWYIPAPSCNLRPCRRNELVERGLLEHSFGESLLASIRKRRSLIFRYEGDRAATKASARETRPPGAVLFRSSHEGVKLGCRDLVVVAQRGVRGVHQAPELFEVPVSERLDRLEDAGVLGDDVPGALQLRSGEEIQVPFRGVAQFLDTKHMCRTLAGRPPVVVAGVGQAALDAGVADDKGKTRRFEVERDALRIQRTAVDEQGCT